jgi:pimeloyl-ACP methyl ester carboxylesterase
MPKVKAGDISMYYEIHGEGEPLVFIDGRNMCHELLYKHVPVFAREYKVISYDNRGVGKSDKPQVPYSLEMMAKDLAGLLDAIGIKKAHFMGYSMGARIAEEMALSYPERVISLILVCPVTWSAELNNQLPLPTVEVRMRQVPPPPEEKARGFLAGVLSEEFINNNRQLIEKLVKIIKNGYGPPHAQNWHAYASDTYDNYQRLPQINAPTLIIAGSGDRTASLDNIDILKERIPGSALTIMDKMPHFLMWEGFDDFNRVMLDFLRRHRSVQTV